MAALVGLVPGRDLVSSRAVAAGTKPQAWMFAWLLLLPWTQPLLISLSSGRGDWQI